MSNKLFIRNLSWSVNEDELADFLGEAGQVVSVKIPLRREDNKPKGIAFVEMATPEDAEEVIATKNGALLDNREVAIDYQQENPDGGRFDRNGGGGRSSRPSNAPKSENLFLHNVSKYAQEADLVEFLSQVGEVVSARIPTDKFTGAPKGFAFVQMATADDAEAVINQLNEQDFQGRAIGINFQDPERSRSAGGRPPARSGGGGYGRRPY